LLEETSREGTRQKFTCASFRLPNWQTRFEEALRKEWLVDGIRSQLQPVNEHSDALPSH